MESDPSTAYEHPTASFAIGLAILFIAQLLSAIMGIYVQDTYSIYGPQWNENLFYSHLVSLPLFVPFYPAIRDQFRSLVASPPITIGLPLPNFQSQIFVDGGLNLRDYLFSGQNWKADPSLTLSVPKHVFTLAVNSLTQYACIRGVNLLGARTTALGVTIVLNLRKLVSLFASIWLFDNVLPPGVLIGAVVVFTGAAVYSWGGTPRPKGASRTNGKAYNGKVKGGD